MEDSGLGSDSVAMLLESTSSKIQQLQKAFAEDVHCKAGRGRSTTIVICYLIQHGRMHPDAAYAYVRSIEGSVGICSAACAGGILLSESEEIQSPGNIWSGCSRRSCNTICRPLRFYPAAADVFTFDDGPVVVIAKANLDGYEDEDEKRGGGRQIWSGVNIVCRVGVATLGDFPACCTAAARFQVLAL